MSGPSRRTRSIARGIGEALITVGVLVLLFAAYQLWWTNVQAAQAATATRDELETSWQAEPAVVASPAATPAATPEPSSTPTAEPTPTAPQIVTAPAIGKAFALMYIPRLSDSVWRLPVVEGVGADELAKGIGHYPGTAMPGEIGNFATAGHRATHGEPLKDIDRLRKGDNVIVETKYGWYVYELVNDRIVTPQDTWVIQPVPGEPDATPTEALITLTTCNPRWASTERWIWWGTLVETRSRADGPPTILSETQEQ